MEAIYLQTNSKDGRKRTQGLPTDRDALKILDRLPPFLVYVLASKWRRHRRKGARFQALVKASGIAERTFVRISQARSWDGVRVGQMARFCMACGVDILHPAKEFTYLKFTTKRNRGFIHLQPHQKERLEKQLSEMYVSGGK